MNAVASHFVTVPLSHLAVSPKNMQRTDTDCVDDLLASIPVHGLIQSLAVEPSSKKGGYLAIAVIDRQLGREVVGVLQGRSVSWQLKMVNGRQIFDASFIRAHVLVLRSADDFWSRPTDAQTLIGHLTRFRGQRAARAMPKRG